jgi:alkylhydroperoxidase family enzyme
VHLTPATCRRRRWSYGGGVTRIPLVDSSDDDADPLARDVLRQVSGARGSIEPNVYRAIANHPRALAAMAQFGSVVYFDNSMAPAQRELAYLTASLTNDCHY